MDVLCYGGGRQTVAACILVKKGVISRPPDRIVMADTGRENPMTWAYLRTYTQPLMQSIGLEIEIAPRELAKVDLYSHKGELLLPVFSRKEDGADGKLRGWCSGEWKRDVCDRYLRQQGVNSGEMWIGYAADETKRIKSQQRGKWLKRFPLVELMLRTVDCLKIVTDFGWPEPHVSSCWMCPNKKNEEWRYIRDEYPELFEEACVIDEEIRQIDIENGHGGVWLHRSRVPLREANLDEEETQEVVRQCGLGMCFV